MRVTHSKKVLAVAVGAALAVLATIGLSVVALARSGAQTPVTMSSPQPQVSPIAVPRVAVPPLGRLTPPDLVVTLRRPASPAAVATLRRDAGVRHVVVASRGLLRVHGATLRVLGVPVGSIRGFTPALTAASTPLWQSVARGELTVAYDHAQGLRRHLGQTFPATGRRARMASVRIGAFATIGLGDAQALLSQPAATALGLAPGREVLIAAPSVTMATLTSDVHRALGPTAQLTVSRATTVNQAFASPLALSRIPSGYLDLYRRAAVTCPGLPWTVLAGIGTVETGNGADVHVSTAGAEGPMQFIPSTWAMYGYDADGDGKADVNDPTDAIFSAARYLCAAGAGRGGQSLDDAIFAYNHAWWYVREVVVLANSYA